MKYKIIQIFLVGLIFCSIYSYKPPVETYLKPPEAPITHLKRKKNVYIAPTGKALEIAKRVSKETGFSQTTISKIMYFENSYRNKCNTNKNGSKDCGLFQINDRTWKSTYTKMGLNMENPDENATFAIYIMKTRGLQDWKYSMKNWAS